MDAKALSAVLLELKKADPYIASVSIVSPDGLILVSTHGNREAAELTGAMMSEILQKTTLALSELKLGDLVTAMVLGATGGMIMYTINEEMILVLEVKPGVHLGNLFRQLNRVVQDLKRL